MSSSNVSRLVLKVKSLLRSFTWPRNMDQSSLKPPPSVANIKSLDYEKFKKTVNVPYIVVDEKVIQDLSLYLKPHYLTVRGIDTIQSINESGDACGNGEGIAKKMVLLNPDMVKSWDDLNEKVRKFLQDKYQVNEIKRRPIELGFKNYNVHDIMDAIFPEEDQRVKSWSIIGHILHVNLRDEKLLHKKLIGQILLETNPAVKMVINKAEIIDTKFRNFKLEVLAETPDAGQLGTIVKVKSNECTFQFDFAKVYWNPRLNTEHSRFLSRLNKGRDVVYDMFAGIGPFAIPAAKRKCHVLANDLNPDAYEWLKFNSKLNKTDHYLTAFNMDARDFVRQIVKDDLINRWKSDECQELVVKPCFHVLMNLPGMAIDFLDAFVGLMEDDEDTVKQIPILIPPLIHCYTFLKRDRNPVEAITELVESTIQHKLPEDYELKMVRAVAPYKDMYRITFKLPLDVLFVSRPNKKQKTS